MTIHIEFEDRDKPYVRYDLKPLDFAKELIGWSKRYDLKFRHACGPIIYFHAKQHEDAKYWDIDYDMETK